MKERRVEGEAEQTEEAGVGREERRMREGGRKIEILYLLAGHSWMGCRLGTHCKTG